MTISLSARRYAVPAIAVLIFSASLLVGLGKLLQESREGSAGIRAMVYWSASQLELEYWRFLDSLGRYAVGAAERDDVLTRLDILWSRLSLYDGGEAGARLSAIDGAPEAIAALGATLRAVEPDIQALKQGDILGYAAIRERLEIHRLPLHDVARRTNLHEQGRAIAFREETAQTYWMLLFFLAGACLGGGGLVVLLVREIGRTRSLLAAGTDAERRAHAGQQRLSAVLRNAPTAIVTVDAGGFIRSFNPAAETLFGYAAHEVIGRNVAMLMPEPYCREHGRYMANYLGGAAPRVIGRRRELSARHKDGHAFPMELALGQMTANGGECFIGFIADITERKRAEKALKGSEQRFRDFAGIAGDWLWETDAALRYTYFSDQMEKITGLPARDILYKTSKDLAWSDPGDPYWAQHFADLDARRPFRDFTFTVPTPDGTARHVRISGKPVFDADGRFQGYRGTGTDITTQVESQAQASRNAALLQAIFDNMVEGINVVDADTTITARNARFLELFDLPPHVADVGAPYAGVIRFLAQRGDYGPCDVEALVSERLRRARAPETQELEIVRPDGRVIEVRSRPLPDGGAVTTYVDITERRRMDEAAHQARKLEAMGRLTGGVATNSTTC